MDIGLTKQFEKKKLPPDFPTLDSKPAEKTLPVEITELPSSDILGESAGFKLDPSQSMAINGLVKLQMGVLIGAAGTGKTTCTLHLIHTMLEGNDAYGVEPLRIETPKGDRLPNIALVAFTGQATQVMKQKLPMSWHKNVMTIHSQLKYAPTEYVKEDGKLGKRFEPTHTKENKFMWDVIIIDEASMVSEQLYEEIRQASRHGCRVYFIGDINQLAPVVGSGIFAHALASLPVMELKHIHRQKDEAANRIIDASQAILKGKEPKWCDSQTDKNWRVLGFELSNDSSVAHTQIINIVNQLSETRIDKSIDPAEPFIFNPLRDRILTPTNGYNPEQSASLVGQAPLNDSLAKVFGAKDKSARIVIKHTRGKIVLAENYRVMATKNEAPHKVDRVTNGMTGRVVSITVNPNWHGDRELVGLESEVDERRRVTIARMLTQNGDSGEQQTFAPLAMIDTDSLEIGDTQESEGMQPASHIVQIEYDTGSIRSYNSTSGIDGLQLAYASTVHKAQGSEAPTIVYIAHQASKFMMNRENFYTAVTRASQRVIVLYTKQGLAVALNRQQLYGDTLEEKVHKYLKLAQNRGVKKLEVLLCPDH